MRVTNSGQTDVNSDWKTKSQIINPCNVQCARTAYLNNNHSQRRISIILQLFIHLYAKWCVRFLFISIWRLSIYELLGAESERNEPWQSLYHTHSHYEITQNIKLILLTLRYRMLLCIVDCTFSALNTHLQLLKYGTSVKANIKRFQCIQFSNLLCTLVLLTDRNNCYYLCVSFRMLRLSTFKKRALKCFLMASKNRF